MQKIKNLLSIAMIVVGLVALPFATVAQAKVDIGDVKTDTCQEIGGKKRGGDCKGGQNIGSIFRTVTNILLFLVGAVAVIMIIISGFRYVTANGDQNAITGAKNTLLYAIIGIVVAFLAYAAVNFVIDQISKAR